MRARASEGVNPYIALSDLGLNLVFILVFFVAAVLALGQSGWDSVKYRRPQELVSAAVEAAPLTQRPWRLEAKVRNDPPGVQRWVFAGTMFQAGSADLRPESARNLLEFARVLGKLKKSWKRVRIEGHTRPGLSDGVNPWSLSAGRAAGVAQLFYLQGNIPPNRLAVAARGDQTLLNGPNSDPKDPRNDRVEIVVEYGDINASTSI